MRHFDVYLAGPITGLSYGESTDWRKYVANKFSPHIHGISPMRAKSYLANEKRIQSSYEEHPLSTSRGIMCRDGWDTRKRDMIFANLLGACQIVTIGTVMEIAMAYAHRKPVVLVIEKEHNIHRHPMLLEAADIIVSDLDQGIEVVNGFFSYSV